MILGVIQARVSSSRLPGKILLPILGEPMIWRQIERMLRSGCIDRLVVATSAESADDPLAAFCEMKGVDCSRGSLDDVLDRFYQAARGHTPEHVVRLTGDCPLHDHGVIDSVIKFHLENGSDYTSNTLEPSFPDGLDVEVMRYSALERAWKEASFISEREHVTPYIHKNPSLFSLANYTRRGENLEHLRWTVDEPEDFRFVESVYEALYCDTPDFSEAHILDFMNKNSHAAAINSGFTRNEGYAKSVREDGKFIKEGE